MSYIVICPDGVQRHEGRFECKADAERFRWWGHACLADGHRIIDPDMTESDLERRWNA